MHLKHAQVEGIYFHVLKGNVLVCCLGIGDHLAIEIQPGNINNVEFEIHMGLCPKFHLDEHTVCEWSEMFNGGDVVVKNNVLQKWGIDLHNYILWSNSRKTLVHVEHIKWVQFPMVSQDHRVLEYLHVYQPPERAKSYILQVLGLND